MIKSDRFKKARGGSSRLLEISCAVCGARVCSYQKDGPGSLKRMYVDRIANPTKPPGAKGLDCPGCKASLGVRMVYKKEDRPAYHLIVGAVAKKMVNSRGISTES